MNKTEQGLPCNERFYSTFTTFESSVNWGRAIVCSFGVSRCCCGRKLSLISSLRYSGRIVLPLAFSARPRSAFPPQTSLFEPLQFRVAISSSKHLLPIKFSGSRCEGIWNSSVKVFSKSRAQHDASFNFIQREEGGNALKAAQSQLLKWGPLLCSQRDNSAPMRVFTTAPYISASIFFAGHHENLAHCVIGGARRHRHCRPHDPSRHRSRRVG